MADTPTSEPPRVEAAEVANLLKELHTKGAVNLDKPVREIVDHLTSIRPDSTLRSYAIAWDHYAIVVRQ